MSLLRPESSLLRLSRRGRKRAAGAVQFTFGKDRPFVVVPRVTGAKAIRPYEGPGTVQDFRIAPAANISRYQVPNAVPGQVRIMPPRPRARPYHQPSYPTETPDQWYGRRGAPNRPRYAAPQQKRHKTSVHSDQRNQEIEERILRQVQQVRVERPAPTGPWPVDGSQEVGNSRSRPSPVPATQADPDNDILTVTPLSRSQYDFLDGVHTRYHLGESEEWMARQSAYALQMGDKDIFPFPPLTNAVALPLAQDLFTFPPLTQDPKPAIVPLQDFEDAMSVDTGPSGQTPIPEGDDLMEAPKTTTEGIVPAEPAVPPLFLTSIFEDPAPEPPVPMDKPYLI